MHFDAGRYYQTQPLHPAIVPAEFAFGGQVLMETFCNPTKVAGGCDFPNTPGVVGFKSGFQVLRDAEQIDAGRSVTFPSGRRNAWRYALFAHAFGVPTDPVSGFPRSVSGVGDAADLMVTLGLWRTDDPATCQKDPSQPLSQGQVYCNDQVGSALVQAGTLMHEMGHGFGLSHGGGSRLPNCKPNYLSVMNYLFQVRGLLGGPLGGVQVDYSSQELPELGEAGLIESQGLRAEAKYATRWFAPLSELDNKLAATGRRASTRLCDGSPIPNGTQQMVRTETQFATGGIDWNQNTVISSVAFTNAQDLNYNALSDAPYKGYNDWANLDLRQIGARSNMLVLSGALVSMTLTPQIRSGHCSTLARLSLSRGRSNWAPSNSDLAPSSWVRSN